MNQKRQKPGPVAEKKRQQQSVPHSNKSAFTGWESRLERHSTKLLLLLPLLLGALLAAMTFELKISEGNDDAMYIEAATKYAADFTGYFYTANAPLYPMLLGLVTMVTGFNLTLFKLLNTVLFLSHLWLMYTAFKRRLPYTVLLPVLLLAAVNSYNLYYASQTYTEMLFLCLQAFFFFVFFSWNEKLASIGVQSAVGSLRSAVGSVQSAVGSLRSAVGSVQSAVGGQRSVVGSGQSAVGGRQSEEDNHHDAGTKPHTAYRYALSIGFAMLLLTLCKNIAIGVLGAVILFFLLQRKWKPMLLVIGGFALARMVWELLKGTIWGFGNQFGAQGAILLQKDAYNPSMGQEDLSGFIDRFFTNFELYTSKRLFQILGFKDPDSVQTHGILAFLVVVLLVFVAFQVYLGIRKSGSSSRQSSQNKTAAAVTARATTAATTPFPITALLLLLYIITMFTLTFIVLQIKWDQPRLIMVYVPLLVGAVLYGFYTYFENKGGPGRVAYVAIAALIVGSSFLTSARKAVEHLPVLKKNIAGDPYYGYTPDWENYLKLSAWCADSLPPTSLVASRKAPMSFVYGKGKAFFPVYTVVGVDSATNISNADTVLKYFNDNHVTHVLIGSLRRNPRKADGYIINTLHRMLQPIDQKYPGKLRMVKQMGTVEPAYLYEIK